MEATALPSVEVLRALSTVLSIPLADLRRAAALPDGLPETYEPPPAAELLDRQQRRVLDDLIRVMADRSRPVPARLHRLVTAAEALTDDEVEQVLAVIETMTGARGAGAGDA